jgi:hypothetical protein
MKPTRLIILLGIFLLSMGMVGGALAAASTNERVVLASIEEFEISSTSEGGVRLDRLDGGRTNYKTVQVEPDDGEDRILVEEFNDPQFVDSIDNPIILYKVLPKLELASVYNRDVYAGSMAGYTLVYSNTGGIERGVWIQSTFPPEAPFLWSIPAPYSSTTDGSEAIWELDDLAMDYRGSIDVQVMIKDSLEISTTTLISSGIYNQMQDLIDTSVITYHSAQVPAHDIYIKDSASDNGSVPSDSSFWLSPDIWVRHSKDGKLLHQNPIPGETNFVYARVRNRMSTEINDITVEVYWSSPALGSNWPGGWGYIGEFTISSLAAGEEHIGWVQWDTPTTYKHFSLRVRVDSPDDPIGEGPDAIVPTDKVNQNNNISMRNVSLLDFPEVAICGFVTTTVYTEEVYLEIINLEDSAESVDVLIGSDDFPMANGVISLDPGDLLDRWITVTNYNQLETMLIPTGFPAEISDVRMMPNESARMTMTISTEVDEGFTIDVEEHLDGNVLGGIRFVRVLPNCTFIPIISNVSQPSNPVMEAYLPSSDRLKWWFSNR